MYFETTAVKCYSAHAVHTAVGDGGDNHQVIK